jgi:hypothetical protein
VLLFVAANLGLMAVSGQSGGGQGPLVLASLEKAGVAVGGAVIILVSTLGGVVLFIVNRDLLRLMEGYGQFNPAHLFRWKELRRYDAFSKAISGLTEERDRLRSREEEVPEKLLAKRDDLIRSMAEQ